MSGFGLLLHHSESIDPELMDWIRHEIDAIVGLEPSTIVLVLGAIIVAFPVALMLLARRRLKAAARTGSQRRRVLYRGRRHLKEPTR
jgi:hypothetical protein